MSIAASELDTLVENDGVNCRSVEKCYACASLGKLIIKGLADRLCSAPGVWSLRECRNPDCRLIWLDPMPHEKDIDKLYRGYTIHHSGMSDRHTGGNFSRLGYGLRSAVRERAFGAIHVPPLGIAENFGASLGKLFCWVPAVRNIAGAGVLWVTRPPGQPSLLDVGCGAGGYLHTMQQHGWDVMGIEFDEKASLIGRDRGIDIKTGTVESVAIADQTFDRIVLQHVIEHLPDPRQTLFRLSKLLKPDGQLILIAPNTDSLARQWFRKHWLSWDPPRHLFMYNRHNLSQIVTQAGLRINRSFTSGRTAKWIWGTSNSIVQYGRCPDGRIIQESRGSRWFGSCVKAIEQVTSDWLGKGEELVIIVTPQRTHTQDLQSKYS